MQMRQQLFLIGLIIILVIVSSSCGPSGPQPGTPEFYWQAALDTFNNTQYERTIENLGALLEKDTQYTHQALPWQLVLTYGLAKGYMEVAQAFEYGARANKTNPTPFRREMNRLREFADRASVRFLETYLQFKQKYQADQVELVFPFPKGSAAQIARLDSVATGIFPQATEIPQLEKQALERNVILAVTEVLGIPEDVAKAKQQFEAGSVQVPRNQFLLAMAKAMYEQAQLYTRTRLAERRKLELLVKNSLEALEQAPDNDEKKQLAEDIKKLMKAEGIS